MGKYIAIFFLALAFIAGSCTDKVSAPDKKDDKPIEDTDPKVDPDDEGGQNGLAQLKFNFGYVKIEGKNRIQISGELFEDVSNFAGYKALDNLVMYVDGEGKGLPAQAKFEYKKLKKMEGMPVSLENHIKYAQNYYEAGIELKTDWEGGPLDELKIKEVVFIDSDLGDEGKTKIIFGFDFKDVTLSSNGEVLPSPYVIKRNDPQKKISLDGFPKSSSADFFWGLVETDNAWEERLENGFILGGELNVVGGQSDIEFSEDDLAKISSSSSNKAGLTVYSSQKLPNKIKFGQGFEITNYVVIMDGIEVNLE